MVLRFVGSQQVAAFLMGRTRSQADAWLRVIRSKATNERRGQGVSRAREGDGVMANGTDSNAAAGATVVRDSRPRTMISSAKDPSGDPLSRWLIVIPVGCLLIAMFCAAALSRLGSASAITSSTVPIDQEIDGGEDSPAGWFHR